MSEMNKIKNNIEMINIALARIPRAQACRIKILNTYNAYFTILGEKIVKILIKDYNTERSISYYLTTIQLEARDGKILYDLVNNFIGEQNDIY